jgi:hypothetical protein
MKTFSRAEIDQALLLLVSGATRTPRSDRVGHLIVPRARNRATQLNLQPRRWAMDNGARAGFDERAFLRMLETHMGHPGCLFVVAPDVVGDAKATLARWRFWSRLIRGLGWIPAFVAQDGLTSHTTPWSDLGALFIGGTTVFKESRVVRSLCGIAQARGLWVHWGRVNSRRRYALALKAGAQSFDGSGFSRWPDTNIPHVAQWHAAIRQQPELLGLEE